MLTTAILVLAVATEARHPYARGRKGYGDTETAGVGAHQPSLADLPPSLDWRVKDPIPVTPVKNQGQCGSCWAFSTAETVESAYIMAGGTPQEFSPQQIASCVESVDGCGGGDTVTALKYLMKEPLAAAAFWPYIQGMTPVNSCNDKACTAKCDKNMSLITTDEFYIGPYGDVEGFEFATEPCYGGCNDQNLTKLAASLAEKGPVSICVNAGAWDSYTGGVMTQKECGGYSYDDLDHCVQLVRIFSSLWSLVLCLIF